MRPTIFYEADVRTESAKMHSGGLQWILYMVSYMACLLISCSCSSFWYFIHDCAGPHIWIYSRYWILDLRFFLSRLTLVRCTTIITNHGASMYDFWLCYFPISYSAAFRLFSAIDVNAAILRYRISFLSIRKAPLGLPFSEFIYMVY